MTDFQFQRGYEPGVAPKHIEDEYARLQTAYHVKCDLLCGCGGVYRRGRA